VSGTLTQATLNMNEFDQFVKHRLKAKHYIRYADDFVIISENKEWLKNQTSLIREFLYGQLKLELHPDKVFIKTVSSGVDFLGMVNFHGHRVLRTKTKRRMFKKLSTKYECLRKGLISEESINQSIQSYLGMLKHCGGYGIVKEMSRIMSAEK